MILDDETTGEYQPKFAFIFHSNGNFRSYVETHKIENGKMLGGKPISVGAIRDLKTLIDSLDIKTHDSMKGYLGKNMLYIDSDKIKPKMVWWTDKKKHRLNFSKSIDIPAREMEVPKLVWVYTANGTSVYAVKGTGINSKLYNAPFYNVSEDGGICFGNVDTKLDLTDIGRAMKRVEANFFNSEFTPHYDFKEKYDRPINYLWCRIHEEWTTEQQKWLMPNNRYKTIEDLL